MFVPAAVLWGLASFLSWRAGAASPALDRRGGGDDGGERLVPAALSGASFLLGSFRSLIADALWLRAESAEAGWERRHETLSAYRLMVALDPGNDSLRAFLVRRLAFELPAREADPVRRRDWIREALALGEESVARRPRSGALASQLAHVYLFACRDDAALGAEVPHAARRARELFERALALGADAGPDAAFAVTVAAAAEGRDALDAGEYAAAAAAFRAAGADAEPFRLFAEACRSGDAAAARAIAEDLARRARPEDAALLARVAGRFGGK